MERPKLFEFTNYRDGLKAFTEYFIEKGETYRSLARKCQSKSPNFLQTIINGQRNLSRKAMHHVMDVFEFDAREKQFFMQLMQLEAQG